MSPRKKRRKKPQRRDVRLDKLKAILERARSEPLSEEEKNQIVGKLSRIHQKEIVVETARDESIIGGIVCKIGHIIYDGSIRNQLERMKEQLRYD